MTPAPGPGDQVRHVLHVSMPTTEGVARVLLGYVQDQVGRGWRVTVACPATGWLGDEAAAAGATVVRWEATRAPGPHTLPETVRLARLVRAVGPDVLHLHSAKAGLAGRLAVRRRVRTVYQPHAWSFLAAGGATGRAARAWERWAGRWTDVLVCVSADERDIGFRAGVRTDVRVVPNGVDLTRFADAPEPASARALLGLAEAPTAVCLGRLCRQKGQDRLVALWPDVRRQVPGARLVLVGDGPDRGAVSGREADGVVVAGAKPDPRPWLAAADVVVVPSRWEGMALAPLEAMATGRSVVGFDVVGLAESVPPGAGRLVPDGATRDFTQALVDRLLDPDLASAEGTHGRRHASERHHARQAAQALAEIYG